MNKHNKPTPVVIGVAGGSGSGKTTIARGILERVGAEHVAYLPHDAYYRDLSHLTLEQRAKVNFDHPDSLETELLIAHIHDLKEWKPIKLPILILNITRAPKKQKKFFLNPLS
jgi:uridine kinase